MSKIPKKEIATENAKQSELIDDSLVTKLRELDITIQNTTVIPNIDNALKILNSNFNGHIWFDDFHKKYFTTYNFNDPDDMGKTIREWDNVDDLELAIFMQRKYKISRMSDEIANKGMRVHAHSHIKHEVRDWINSIKWDGKSRIETFFIDCAGTKDCEYTRAVSKNFWIGLIARIYSPGCKLDTMPILEGGQGEFKSTLLTVIGGKWHCEAAHDLTNKDFFQGLHGKLLIEFADLSGFNRSEVNLIKDILTRRSDYIRLPYAKGFKDFPRQSVFSGTTNKTTYLKDETGARRFWPISIGTINIQRAKDNREQLFAEALILFNQNSKWWIMPSETEDEQEARREIDPWESLIANFIIYKEEITTQEIMKECLNIQPNKQDKYAEMRIGGILRMFGWKSRQKRIGNLRPYVYFPKDALILPEQELPTQENINWED